MENNLYRGDGSSPRERELTRLVQKTMDEFAPLRQKRTPEEIEQFMARVDARLRREALAFEAKNSSSWDGLGSPPWKITVV